MIAFKVKLILSFKIANLPELLNSFKKTYFFLLISFSLKVEIKLPSPVLFFFSSIKSFSLAKNCIYSWLTALMALVISLLSFCITETDFLDRFSMFGRTYYNSGLISVTSGESGLSTERLTKA